MKTFFTLIFTCAILSAAGKNTFQKLTEVNTCWKAQSDINPAQLPSVHPRSEKEWIRLHLQLVEQTLRSRSTANLTPAQKAARLTDLDHLHQYWQAGAFPINEDYAYHTPIFIDKHNNFCAVGYLVKASGHEAIARMIAARTNLAYVKEMHYPELDTWAARNGFTKDELAWIQPSYPAVDYAVAIGKGVNGEVRELLADGDTLYTGGSFTKADSTIDAANIAFVTENSGTYTWHSMGTGVNGPVNAIAKYQNRIYIAGAFSMAGDSVMHNVAYWEGGRWHSPGCLFGEVHDLAVLGNTLYAAGSFDICASLTNINFAALGVNGWQQLPGLSGHVNTLEVMDTSLVLGGAFHYGADTVNAIKWSLNGGFRKFALSTRNEVNDFEFYKDTLYAACKWMPGGDSTLLFLKLRNDTWDSTFRLNYQQMIMGKYLGTGISLNTLLAGDNHLMLGGSFVGNSGMTSVSNCIDFTPAISGGRYYYGTGNWFEVDSTIHKMIYFKGDLIAGGSFKRSGFPHPQIGGALLNGIGKRKKYASAVNIVKAGDDIMIYPNPAAPGALINIKSGLNATDYTLMDNAGRIIISGDMKEATPSTLKMPQATGIYLLKLNNKAGKSIIQRITIR